VRRITEESKKEDYVKHVIFLLVASINEYAGYGMDDRGVWVPVPVESRICTFPYRPDLLKTRQKYSPLDCNVLIYIYMKVVYLVKINSI
jgi:hypothetical protein